VKFPDGVYLNDQPRQPWRMCPYCGELHDGMTGMNDRPDVTPDDGSVMICASCGEFGILDSTAMGSWRKPTRDETRAVLADSTVVLAIATVRAVRDKRRS